VAEDPARVSADVTVINHADLVRSQKMTVADVLRSQPGLDVAASGGPGKATSVFLRGANAGQTLVLIDGVRVSSATLGQFDWGNLSTADIERIEIARGPQSSLYGADAMGGVIQIFTRKGKGPMQVRSYTEGGSYSSGKAGANVSGTSEGGIGYALGVDGLSTKGISAVAKTSERDPYRQWTGTAHINAPVGNGEVELVLSNTNGRTSLDNGTGPADATNHNATARQTVSSVKASMPLSGDLDSSLQLSRSTDISNSSDPVTAFNNSDFRTDIDQLTWQNHADLSSLSLLAGAEWRRDKGFSSSAKLDKSFTQTSAFAGASYQAGPADLSASLRYDANSVSANKATYKLGSTVTPLEGLRLTANYGTGFKAPSINNLYFPGFGNPNLVPEQSRGWDAGLHVAQAGNAFAYGADVVWFDQRFTDLIVFQTAATTFLSAPANVAKARSNGLELSGHLDWKPVYVRGNWTFLHAVNSADGTQLARRAKDKGSLVIGADISGLNVEVQQDIVGPRFSSAFNQKLMQGYQKTDIRARYAINDQWMLNARVENAGNKVYEEVKGYGVFGRAWYAGVSTSF